MKVFITFTEQKNFGSRRDVVSANGFGIVGNIAFNIFREKRKVIFTRLGLGKASTLKRIGEGAGKIYVSEVTMFPLLATAGMRDYF